MWIKWLPWKFIIRRLARSHGFIDPVAVFSHIERFAQPSEVVVPIETLRAGMVFHARGFVDSRVIQQNLDWLLRSSTGGRSMPGFWLKTGVCSLHPGWVIDNKTHVHFSEPPLKYAFSNYFRGDVLHSLPEPQPEKSIVCNVGMATAAAMFEQRPGLERQIAVRVPLTRHEAEDAGARYAVGPAVTWDRALSGACHVDVPDAHFCALYEAALRTIVLHSPGEGYPGPYTYKRFWFRDAVFILHTLLCGTPLN
jgi:hypothetical protein